MLALLVWPCRDGTAKLGDVGMAKIMAEGYVSGGQGAFGTLAWCDRLSCLAGGSC